MNVITSKSKHSCETLLAFLILIFAFVNNESIHAQEPTIDSLQTILAKTTAVSERLNLMDLLIDELITSDLGQAIILSKKALDLAQESKDREAEAIALNNMGLVLYETDERPSSIKYFEESERIADELGLRKLQAYNLMSAARFYRYFEFDSTKTVNNFLKSIDVCKSVDFHYGTARSYAKLASFYTRYNQIDLCKEYLDNAAIYYIKRNGGAKTVAHYYNEVGDKLWDNNPKESMDLYFKGIEYAEIPRLMVSLAKAYSYIGDSEMALSYLNKAIPQYRNSKKEVRALGIALTQMAEVYIQLGDYEAADKACDDGIELLSNVGRSYQRAMPALYRTKGFIKEQEGKDESALEYYTISLEEAVRIKFGFELINTSIALGFYYSSRDIKKAKLICEKALKDAKLKKHTNLEIQACDCLYKINKEEFSHLEALKYHERKTILNDSVSIVKVISTLEINNRIAKKDKLIAEQAYQQEIKEKELNNQYALNTSLSISMLMGLLLIGFLAMGFLRIRRQNVEINTKTEKLEKVNLSLKRSNNELESFAHMTSHDLKTPLRGILSFTELLRREFGHDENSRVCEYLTFIEKSGNRMKQLINDILEFSQLSGNNTIEKSMIDLNQLVDELSQVEQNANQTKTIMFEVGELPNLKWNQSKIFLLFKNLIENGIKYNQSENPTIKIYYTYRSKINTICIEDNGIGIEKKYFDKVFDMFNRLHSQDKYEGTGLGLATCKKIVEEFEGNIRVSSKINSGTVFKIEVPNHLIHHPDLIAI